MVAIQPFLGTIRPSPSRRGNFKGVFQTIRWPA
jgi:hypothetical protein